MNTEKDVIQYKKDLKNKIKEFSIMNTRAGLQNTETLKLFCTSVDIDAAKILSNALKYYNSLKEQL